MSEEPDNRFIVALAIVVIVGTILAVGLIFLGTGQSSQPDVANSQQVPNKSQDSVAPKEATRPKTDSSENDDKENPKATIKAPEEPKKTAPPKKTLRKLTPENDYLRELMAMIPSYESPYKECWEQAVNEAKKEGMTLETITSDDYQSLRKRANQFFAEVQPEGIVVKPRVRYNFISAADLCAAFEDNEIAAEQKYGNRYLAVDGVIDSIAKDILGTPYVTLSINEGSLGQVQCMFESKNETKLLELRRGNHLTVYGLCSGRTLMNVILHNCSLSKEEK